MTDFSRLAEAFTTFARHLEMKLSAKNAAVAARRADVADLRVFLDRPGMLAGPGYSEGVLRILRLEAELVAIEADRDALRLDYAEAVGRRDKCLARMRRDAAAAERRRGENDITELAGRGGDTSLAQPGGD